MEYKTKGLNELSKQANDFVKSVGFGTNDLPLRIALIHSEISKAFEAFRKDKFANMVQFKQDKLRHEPDAFLDKRDFEINIKDTFEDEIADSIIRLLDLCGHINIDIEYHIQQKMKYNETRGHKFGGKKF